MKAVAGSLSPRRIVWGSIAFIVLASLFLFLFNLGAKPFWDYDEATYANVVKDSLHHHDLLTLNFNGNDWYEKPPTYFWLSAGFDSVFHAPEFSYRLTAALAGLACIALVMLIALELGAGLPLAMAAGLILLTIGPFVDAGRQVRLDVPVIACILLAAYAFLKGQRTPVWYLGVGAALGLGIMFKSVIALLAGIFILAYAVVYRDFKWLKSWHLWLGVLIGIAIVAPWHVYESAAHGAAFWKDYLGFQVISRFTSDILPNSPWTWWSYLGYLARYAAPWSLLFLVALGFCVFSSRDTKKMPEARPLLACALTTLGILAVFFIAGSKLPSYLLPAYPFVALSTVFGYAYLQARFPLITKRKEYAFAVGALASLLATGNLTYFWLHLTPIERASDTIALDEQKAGLIVASDPDAPLYTYEYNLWDTMRFYAGGVRITKMMPDTELSKPIFLAASSKFMQHNSFAPPLAAHFKTLYEGPALTLYYFTP